eukprot:CAMPEP_0175883012 /NCGR_PEP_ID=MMETSP0107_2-20121207/43738_1 /TAXON_ID=195067 ORGANISM="Goniomonas pacifica, Strain CCMP1869" /NCGR_SAMPLE_ID=MMETSP0107_2 /ASSEMBLY_ACC=CAM_ASM_000203 /LENGTH=143 /DNA_ID=CAMNT_0017203023 /DNA_START=176 /DNA_END=607 /DNA_ORIENTATION=-
MPFVLVRKVPAPVANNVMVFEREAVVSIVFRSPISGLSGSEQDTGLDVSVVTDSVDDNMATRTQDVSLQVDVFPTVTGNTSDLAGSGGHVSMVVDCVRDDTNFPPDIRCRQDSSIWADLRGSVRIRVCESITSSCAFSNFNLK